MGKKRKVHPKSLYNLKRKTSEHNELLARNPLTVKVTEYIYRYVKGKDKPSLWLRRVIEAAVAEEKAND